jgi:hypothetical protein
MTPWIHIGECPVCVNGLCRVRYCEDSAGLGHLYAMCDECEALWLEPSTSSQRQFPSAEAPVCPICARPLYGPQAHWATAQELSHSDWTQAAIFDVPSSGEDDLQESVHALANETSVEFVTTADIAGDLDAQPQVTHPSSSIVEARGTVAEPCSGEADVAYGQDEPKPGC